MSDKINYNDGQNDSAAQASSQKDRQQGRAKIAAALIKIFWAILIEGALILWISAEFLSSIQRPQLAVWLLGVSLVLCFFYIAHKLSGSKVLRRFRNGVYTVVVILTLCVAFGCRWGTSLLNEKWRLANEPQVIPPVVQLHDGKCGRISRVLIFNPSDSWIYKLTILIQVKSNSVPLGSVASWLAEGKTKDVFEESKIASSNPHPGFPATPNFPMMDAFGLEFSYGNAGGRLLILSALAPNEDRVLWIKGSSPTNSFATIDIVEYSKEPFSLKVEAEGVDGKFARVIWDGPSSNSTFWKHFPGVIPVDLSFGGGYTAASNTPPNTPPPTNSPSLELPGRRIRPELVTPQLYP